MQISSLASLGGMADGKAAGDAEAEGGRRTCLRRSPGPCSGRASAPTICVPTVSLTSPRASGKAGLFRPTTGKGRRRATRARVTTSPGSDTTATGQAGTGVRQV